jgi:hypothetical protein
MRIQVIAAAILASLAAPAAPPQQMRFTTLENWDEQGLRNMEGGRIRIFASGPIDAGAAERFRTFVRKQGIDWGKVYLNSPGGSLPAAIALGKAIRALKFDTAVQHRDWQIWNPPTAACTNECVFAFVGGVYRFVWDSSGRLGLSTLRDGGEDRDGLLDGQAARGTLVPYLRKMGVNPSVLSTAAASSRTVWLSADQAEKLGLANNGSQPTTAETGVRGGRPYLFLEQIHDNGTARVHLFCRNRKLAIDSGIVTQPEVTDERASRAQRTYLELDDRELLPVSGRRGLRTDASVMWVSRELRAGVAQALARADELGSWVDLDATWRWGAYMDLKTVRPRIADFVRNCR